MKEKYLLALLVAASANTHADTVYLCKGYSGGTFWASTHCSQHNGNVDRTFEVPNNLPWDQRVALAEQELRGLAACASLDRRVKELDDMARQPQSAATQDWIRAERKDARDRQFQLRC